MKDVNLLIFIILIYSLIIKLTKIQCKYITGKEISNFWLVVYDLHLRDMLRSSLCYFLLKLVLEWSKVIVREKIHCLGGHHKQNKEIARLAE